jgi:hypothetical protein
MYKPTDKNHTETFVSAIQVQDSVNTVKNLEGSITRIDISANTNFKDISNNLGVYKKMATYLEQKNDVYHYNDKQDPMILLAQNPPKDIRYVINEDINKIKLYQNTIYISGAIACATALLAIILLTKTS